MTNSDSTNKTTGSELKVIDAHGLIHGSSDESAKLLAAAKAEGFFYLNLQNLEKYDEINKIIDGIYELEKDLFNLPDVEKMQYDVDKLSPMKLNGYKPKGRNFGGIGGKRDGFESYAIPKDGVLQLSEDAFIRPPLMDQNMPLLQNFVRYMLEASVAIYSSLSKSLGLPMYGRFEDFHRADRPSPCLLRLLKYHAQPFEERGPPQTPHTDLGSLTFLFTKQPGLQVLPDGSQDWIYVEPKPGHAIVNYGDAMSMLTNGVLHSSLHRVVPMPERAMETRYSFAYLQRAEEHTRMTGLESSMIPARTSSDEVLTSGGWLEKKFRVLRASSHQKEKESVLTGRAMKVL